MYNFSMLYLNVKSYLIKIQNSKKKKKMQKSIFAEPRKIECGTCLHSLTPMIKSRKDKSKKKNQKKAQENIGKEYSTFAIEIDPQSNQMYMSYSDAVLATLNNNVSSDGSKISDLIESLQKLFYFDGRTQQYIHPQIIPDSHLEFIIENNPPIASRFEVRNGLIYPKF